MLRKNIYKWHRTASLIIAVPVILWAASGFMHPIMTTIRPKIATQFLATIELDSSTIKIPLQTALLQNHIDSFVSARFVHIEKSWFYQVQTGQGKEPVYLATENGKMLSAGNWLYAQYLAKQFLEGQPKPGPGQMVHMNMPEMAISASMPMGSNHDCCNDATDFVLNNEKGCKVTDAVSVTSFNSEYKSINRILPVYRVDFDRADGIRIYVETAQDRFAFAMDNKRRIFDRIFTLVHTWSWLEFLGKGKLAVEFLLVSTAFLTTLMGMYIFFTTKTKKPSGNEQLKARRYHRYTSMTVALFTLMFTFSGTYHVLSKFKADKSSGDVAEKYFRTADTDINLKELQCMVKEPVVNIGIVSLAEKTCWRLYTKPGIAQKDTAAPQRKDLMKDALVPSPPPVYISMASHAIIPEGEILYARSLATRFSGHQENAIVSAVPVTKFDNEYNFTDKRLPVWKISYASNSNERYYVETSSGKLAKYINDRELMEGYSFAFLHKHEFMAWGGKPVKDFSTMFWAMSQIAMVAVGLIFYFRKRNRERPLKS